MKAYIPQGTHPSARLARNHNALYCKECKKVPKLLSQSDVCVGFFHRKEKWCLCGKCFTPLAQIGNRGMFL